MFSLLSKMLYLFTSFPDSFTCNVNSKSRAINHSFQLQGMAGSCNYPCFNNLKPTPKVFRKRKKKLKKSLELAIHRHRSYGHLHGNSGQDLCKASVMPACTSLNWFKSKLARTAGFRTNTALTPTWQRALVALYSPNQART